MSDDRVSSAVETGTAIRRRKALAGPRKKKSKLTPKSRKAVK